MPHVKLAQARHSGAAERLCCGRVVSVLEGGYGEQQALVTNHQCVSLGVDCGPSGEYVPTIRREAFDSCLRAHLVALTGCCQCDEPAVDRDADARLPSLVPGRKRPAGLGCDSLNLVTDGMSSGCYSGKLGSKQHPRDTALSNSLTQRDSVIDAFFQCPPPQTPNLHSVNDELTAGNLAQLGGPLNFDDKIANFMREDK